MPAWLRPAPLLLACLWGCARPTTVLDANSHPVPHYDGPDTTTVDIVRPGANAPRIYLYVTLPDGEPGLFQVDTGASISVLSQATADRLGLDVLETGGFVEGLSGRAPMSTAVLTSLQIGEAVLADIEVAVGVPGVSDRAGAMVLDGILGNNVWSRFVLDVDYPRDLISLHRPGTVRMPRRSTPLFFDGGHVLAPIVVRSDSEPVIENSVFVQVDTGAGELWLIRDTGQAFAAAATEGIEPVYGIGASEILPPTQYLQKTRRIPLESVGIGGRTVDVDFDAAWLGFDRSTWSGPASIKGLAGHELMSEYRAVFDYQEGLFVLRRSKGRRPHIDGHSIALDMDVERFGPNAPERAVYRAELHTALGELPEADALLEAFLDSQRDMSTTEADARVLLARIRRAQGDLTGASQALAPLSAAELIEHDQIVSTVGGLLLDGHVDAASALAHDAVEARPDDGSAHVALSDTLLAQGHIARAEAALLHAGTLASNPDAHLTRRARIRLADGDRLGAMALLRRMIDLYPTNGVFLWFYTLLIDGAEDPMAPTLSQDVQRAMSRLHPQQRPFDFLVGAHMSLDDADAAAPLFNQGTARDCADAFAQHAQDNCTAWYLALAQRDPDVALRLVESALAETGPRADYLDTLAMVHLSRGELVDARDAAMQAARLAPDDIYMLWQAERLDALIQ